MRACVNMDKITFLNELELALDDLPREEKDSIMHKYENLFYEEELKGTSESQIIKKLNDSLSYFQRSKS